MHAQNADELRRMIETHPEESPALFLRDDSLASFLYDHRTFRELKSAFHRDADPDECRRWNLSTGEWRENVAMAMIAVKARKGKKDA
jgi:hypothetical protein